MSVSQANCGRPCHSWIYYKVSCTILFLGTSWQSVIGIIPLFSLLIYIYIHNSFTFTDSLPHWNRGTHKAMAVDLLVPHVLLLGLTWTEHLICIWQIPLAHTQSGRLVFLIKMIIYFYSYLSVFLLMASNTVKESNNPLVQPWTILYNESITWLVFQANATGRSAKTVREFLEKHYTDEVVSTEAGAIKLVVKALLEVVQSGAKNVEVAIMKPNEPMRVIYFCLLVCFNNIGKNKIVAKCFTLFE